MSTEEEDKQLVLVRQIQISKKIETQIKQAIQIIGNAGRYQVLLIIYLIFCFIFATYLLAGTSYFFMNPKFNCSGRELSEDEACMHLDQCTIQNDYTITTKVNLICQAKTQRSVIQSMLGIGACLGVLFINFVSDYKGRKFSFVFSLAAGIASTALLIVGAYTGTWQIFILSQILAGFYGNSIMTLIYVMADRLMSKKYSNFTIVITNGFFGLTEISLVLFTGYLNWEDLSFAFMLIPGVALIFIAFFIIIEDPVYLFTKKEYEHCKNNLKKIAVVNKTEDRLDKCYEAVDELKSNHVQLNNSQTQGELSKKLKYFRLLSKRSVYGPILLIGLYNLGGNLTYYMLNYAISTIGSSFEWNIAFFGIFEFLGILPIRNESAILVAFGEKIPRKKGMLIIVGIHACLSLFFITDLSNQLQTVIIVFIRFIFASLYMLYIFFVVETFPQHIRATCFGIVQFISQSGKFFAPFCINLADAIGISPILLTGFISILLCIVPLLPLKETLGVKQVDELKQSLIE